MNTLRNTLKAQYSQIPNELITDLTISAGSLRVLLYLFTKPDNWSVYNADICKQLNITEQTLSKYWKELLASPWLRREQKRDSSNKITGGYLYQIGTFSRPIKSMDLEKVSTIDNNKPCSKNNLNTNKRSNVELQIFADVVSYLNAKLETSYRANSAKTKSLISARQKEGFTLEDFKTVIDKKSAQWGKDPKMSAYLRPETLFGNKFESYLNEKITKNAKDEYLDRCLNTNKRFGVELDPNLPF